MSIWLKLALTATLIPVFASAHGPVTTLTQTSGEYTVEFEYNTLGNISTGNYTIFDTYLLKNGVPVEYVSAFMRIGKRDGDATMAGSLAETPDSPGFASMSGVINTPGTYAADISFYKDGERFAAASFDFNVKEYQALPGSKPASSSLLSSIGIFIVGLIIGVGGAWQFKVRKKS